MPRAWRTGLLVLLGYAAVSFAFFGWRLLPHPGRVVVGDGFDPQIFIWSFAWWPHAIATWTNPFVSHAIYAPSGVNLAWTASAPGLAVAFAPVTALFGPVAAYNAAIVLLPALAAWTAFLLCRHLTGSTWASLVGGYLFGFSAYVLDELWPGHPNLIGVFLVPLVALAVLRYVEGELDGRGLAWRLGLLLALQLWISTEIAFTLTLALAIGGALAFGLVRAARPRLRSSLGPIAAGYGLAVVLAAPLVAYTLIGFVPGTIWNGGASGSGTNQTGTDLLNFVAPAATIGIGRVWAVPANLNAGGGADGYLGLPTLLIVVLFAIRARRSPGARFLLAAFATAAVLALGTALWLDGHRLVGLPWWRAARHLPVLDNVFAFRFALYVSLGAAVVVALWTATARGRIYPRPYVLPLLAMLALVPTVWGAARASFAPRRPRQPAFFTTRAYRSCLRRNETLAIFPFGEGGGSLLWQAETGFWFRLAADGLQPVTKHGERLTSFERDQVVFDLDFAEIGRPTADRLLAFAADHGVDRIVTVAGAGYPSRAQLRRFGPTQAIGGVLVSPACGDPPLTDRDLSRFVAAYRREVRSRPNVGYCVGRNFSLVPDGLDPAGPLAGARRAIFVAGRGVTCPPAPPGFRRRGFATAAMNVPPGTYRYYVR